MSLSRPFLLCLLPAAACCLAPLQDCQAQKTAKADPFVVNPQTYAVLDISGTSTNGKKVEKMAFDDSNNAAFSFWDGSAHKVGLWQSGALAADSPKETGSQITLTVYQSGSPGSSGNAGTPDRPYNAGTLSSSNGTGFDQLTGGGSPLQPNPVGAGFYLNAKGDLATSTYMVDNVQNHYFTVFWPYGTKKADCIQSKDASASGFLPMNLVSALLADGTLVGGCDYAGKYRYYSPDPTGYTYQGEGICTMTAKDATPTLVAGCNPDVISHCWEQDSYGITAISPAGIRGVSRWNTKTNNQSGTVTSSSKTLYINDQVLDQNTSSPPVLGDIAAVNDQKDVVVTGTYDATSKLTNGAYFKKADGNKQLFLASDSDAGLLPATAQRHLRNIYPFQIRVVGIS